MFSWFRLRRAEGLVMKTVDCDWMKPTNGIAHKTSEYENSALVLRRGQTFKVKVTFQREFNKNADKVIMEFAIGSQPQLVNDTKIRVSLSETLDATKWSMVLADSDDKTITVEINIPPNAIIGKYSTAVEFESKLEDGQVSKSRDKEPDIIVLFNPWCKADAVFLEDEEKREEYVLNDTGIIYRGSTWRISPKMWNFGQFEENILDCALYILDSDKRTTKKSGKWLPKRRDPVWVARAMSATINTVLVGNWSGDYEGGSSPTSWSGSVKILSQYFSSKLPVKFGQCWVFSGVMTTVLRALGIPTRSVTNFASAHDTEGSMTIDSFYGEDGEDAGIAEDSVWNFHVWNESWMARPDLPSGYGGWQVVDATPQEVSLDLFQTGPAPLAAIKKGEVYLGYETPFVFAEVNADRVSWIVEKDADNSYIIKGVGRKYTSAVGKYISTKKVGLDEREDITDLYKFKEGSDEERAAFRLAYGFGSQPEYQQGFLAMQGDIDDGIDLSFSTNPVDTELFNGDEFTVTVTMQNKRTEACTVNLSTSLQTIKYTGEKRAFVKRSKFTDIKMEPNASISKEMKLVYNEYAGKLVDDNAMRMVSVATVKETGKMYSEDYVFGLENREEDIKIKVSEGLKVGEKATVTVQFPNHLPVKLTHVTVTLEGAGLSAPVTHKVSGHVMPGEKSESTFAFTPKKAGKRTLIVDIDSRQLQDYKQSVHVDIAPASAEAVGGE